MLLLLSTLLWGFLCWYSKKHPINNVEYSERGGGGGGTTTTVHNYYYYKVKAPHHMIDPSQPIICYDVYGAEVYRVPPYDSNTDYTSGVYSVPGNEVNTTVESISTATYYVYYSTDDLVIDYENAEFKIAKKLISSPAEATVSGTFEFTTIATPIRDIASVIDGKWDTQVQTVFYAEPPSSYRYAILDLGAAYDIQAIDIVAGFYKPDNYRKFDISFYISLEYSLNGSNWYVVSDSTYNFEMTGGSSKSFEEDELGIGFRARYIRLLLERVEKIDFDKGRWVIALTEIAAYSNIIIKSEATLIPTTALTTAANLGDSIVNVTSTVGFTEPESTEEITAYIDENMFTYTGITPTSFTGCTLGSATNGLIGDRVSQTISSDTTIYDDSGLRQKLGDRVYKNMDISDSILYTTAQLDYLSKRYLQEFYKNHNKVSIDVLYAPHLQIGQTIKLTDSYNGINQNYFISEIQDKNGFYTITLSRYPD